MKKFKIIIISILVFLLLLGISTERSYNKADVDAMYSVSACETNEICEQEESCEPKNPVEVKTESEYKTMYAGMTAAQIAAAKAAEAAELARLEAEMAEAEKNTVILDESMGTYNWGVVTHVLNDADRNLIERVVAAEARGQCYEGMLGVAQVIRERAECWGMTAREVVTAKSQFASPFGGEISQEVKDAVSAVFDNGVRVFAEKTTHFHATYVNPSWNRTKIYRGTIEAHLFWG